MSKIIKQTISCIFILMTLGLFITCDDPNLNPFTNNQGEKVVVEPPTIYNISPVSGSYLSGTVTITATAKAYIKVEKVEVYIYKDEENGQEKVDWTDKGIQLSGDVKVKQVSFVFDTSKYNSGNDGPIRLKFRVFDTTKTAVESIQLIYTIKNNPSVITMAYPSDTDAADLSYPWDADITGATELPKIPYEGEIRGSIRDVRGLRPGFPQIKFWPHLDPNDPSGTKPMPEPADDDPQWGWASLFLSCDDPSELSDDGTYFGSYADRTEMRVVISSTFSLKMAEHTIVQDPRHPDNPDLRLIRYRVGTPADDNYNGKHVPYVSGRVFNFRIRTRDVDPDPDNGGIPVADPDLPYIEGHYPPMGLKTPIQDNFTYRENPVKVRIWNPNVEMTVTLNNDDKEKAELDAKPNKYITETDSYKIVKTGFRLRLFLTLKGIEPDYNKTTLEYLHKSTGKSGVLAWAPIIPVEWDEVNDPDAASFSDDASLKNGIVKNYVEKENRGKADSVKGTLFIFDSNTMSPSPFTDSTGVYTLTFKVPVGTEFKEFKYTVRMDGTGPKVSIRYIHGAADVEAPTGALKVDYTVNGNIQATVDRTDASGIMAFRSNSDMGALPYVNDIQANGKVDEGRPMVKWIVEEANATVTEPPASSSVLTKLKTYEADPTHDNLRFFKEIDYTQASSLTSLPSGWVRTPLSENEAARDIEADRIDHFKLNTLTLTDKGYYWLYVIAMDQVQNLGYTVKKIYVDQETDNPRLDNISPLSDKNAGGTKILVEDDVNVTVEVNTGTGARTKTGNWIGGFEDGKRNNVLRDEGIGLSFRDDDGISLDNGGITIILTDLNTPKAPNSPYTFTLAKLKEIISGNDRDWTGMLSQKIMADILYGSASDGKLKDGMYKIEFKVKDDINKKVKITPALIDGDTPETVEINAVYYFAVSRDLPKITITEPNNNALGSTQPQDIYGEVKSRFTMQSMYITFNPNVAAVSPSTPNPSILPIKLSLTPKTGTPAAPTPDADGYYTYTWEYKNVIFHPEKAPGDPYFSTSADGGVRNFTVEAYDRIGNKNEEKQTVLIDESEPEITLVEFNHGRDPDENNKLWVYGKVPFTLSASAQNGLSEIEVNGVKMSAIKWWVLPATDDAPTWNTSFTSYPKTGTTPSVTGMTPSTWTGGGNFRLDQQLSGGKYTGVIDTRYLDETVDYKFYYMARDKAGKTVWGNVIYVIPQSPQNINIDSFTVDQTRDYPTIFEKDIRPEPNNVLSTSSLIISGTVSDADLFDPKKLGTANYVQIRFPEVAGKPASAADWGKWISITIPATYSSKDGGIDPSGAIVYKFDVTKYSGADAEAAKTYLLGKDGIKYYQIRVTDEPDAGVDGKNYGKNPDEFMRNKPAYDIPNYNTVWNYHNKVSIVFPLDTTNPLNETPPDAYTFIVDGTKPEIYFNLYDPTVGHENYKKDRPTFSKVEQLIAALNNDPISQKDGKPTKGNYVKEDKLVDLTMSWSFEENNTNYSFIKVIVKNPDNPAVAGEYPWDLSSLTADDKTRLETIFTAANQGNQVISFEATDMVPLTGRQSWIFLKDTQGPAIEFSNINRAIKRATIPAATTPPFPAGWPPNKTVWDAAWGSAWKTITENWPSEYAFKTAAEVFAALTAENSKEPSTINGDENTIPVIQGSFEDEYSSIIRTVSANAKTIFQYRFKDKTGAVLDIPASGLAQGISTSAVIEPGYNADTFTPGFTDTNSTKPWIQKEVKPGKTDKEADWEIILNKENGFTGTDGENMVDIRVADSADNVSEIYNVRFLLDSAPPWLGSYDSGAKPVDKEFIVAKVTDYSGADPVIPGPLDEDKRVFSAAGSADGTGVVFQLRGRVNDANLNNMTITIGQDGTTAYTVRASVDINPLSTASSVAPSTGKGVIKAPDDVVTGTPADPSAQHRLSLKGPYKAGTTTDYDVATDPGVPEWEWTFDILEKDVHGLRAAAGIGTDAEYSTRRFIRVTASDKAGKKVEPVEWAFYLDTVKPVIEYTNLDKGRNGSSFESDVKLSVLVSDDTKIKDAKYIIGRWEYSIPDAAVGQPPVNKWRWYNSANSKWDLTVPPAVTSWPSVFTSDTTPTRLTSMDFTINQAMLDAANAKAANTFPANLFNTEGQYRLDLCVTDFSIGNGNAHNTTAGDNTEPPSTTGFKDTGYNPKTGTGSASARVFYIDKKDPTLRWADTIEEKTYFRNETVAPNVGQVIFGFIAGDGNTLQNWTAVVKDKAGNIVQTSGGAIKWDVGKGKTSQAIAEPVTVAYPATDTAPATVAGKLISEASIDEQYFEIKPFMTNDALSGGTPWDMVAGNSLPTYSITITVTDGANRTSSITKQFTLDNIPPQFIVEKYNPLSYKYGTDDKPADPEGTPPRSYSYDAVTGKLNIRGNTTDNSNQIKSISYYVVNKADSADFTAYPTPDWVTSNNKWLSGINAEIKTDGTSGTTLIQLDEGTLFAWSILAPNTTLFLDGSTYSKTYVKQSIQTGGKSIKDTPATASNYQDLEPDADPTKWKTNDARAVPKLTFPDLNNPYADNPKVIYGAEPVGLITIYVRAEDAAGNVAYDALKYWIWPEGDRPIITAINTPNSGAPEIERLLNGTIRLAGMAKDNERVKYVWFRVLDKDGNPYGTGSLKPLSIPKWQDTDKVTGAPIGGNWDEAGTGNQTAVDYNVNGVYIGALKNGDPIPDPPKSKSPGGWYMANGGHSRDVSWWAYINTNGELDPQGDEEKREFFVEVRAQDVTYDEKNDKWMDYVSGGYKGMASALTDVSRTNAWVVANAPLFDKQRIAPVDSAKAEAAESTTDKYWDTVDNISIRNRSSYKVTVTHDIGLGSIRWSPTQWYKDKAVNADIGAFRANPNIDAFNLLATNIPGYTPGTSYVYINKAGTGYLYGTQADAFKALTDGDSTMAAHVVIKKLDDTSTYAMECDVFVDMRADLLLSEMLVNDPDYGNGSAARAGQTKNSVRYPLYMTASDISKPTPITSRGDALLPIDNLPPYGMYTLNRKPAGTAVTIGGEAGDDGPVKGVARVVLWFQKKDSDVGVSWHNQALTTGETTLPAVKDFKEHTDGTGPSWWDDVGFLPAAGGVLPATGVKKPYIPATSGATTGGDYAIVIDTNSPSVGKSRWGHSLPTGFADGGIGKLWYAEINSYGLESGPIDLHYVVIDKAGNAKYYKERLVIMNDVAVIDRVKLATDIRHNSSFPSANSFQAAGKKFDDKTSTGTWPILKDIRNKVPLGGDDVDIQNDIKKGISDWISASALGADKVIDFNVRNNLFALRVETTKPPKTKARTFSIEYISGANLMSDTGGNNRKLTDIKAGNIYIINERGTARWGTFGAEGDDWKRGYAFIATVSGSDLDDLSKANIGTGSAWEITTALPLSTPASTVGDVNAESAEFQYGTGAFGTIVDCAGPNDVAFPPTGAWGTWTNNNWSLFVLRVYDGDKTDYFGDFTILRVRVNNDDKSLPFAQLYDLNPKTEGQDRSNIAGDDQTVDKRRSVSPMFIGEGTGSNRTKGGLWNDSPTLGKIEKPGHIEPRRMSGNNYNTAPYTNVVISPNVTQQHSLSSAQMGGAATSADAAITKPFVNPAGFIGTTDLVSGQVVLRGYAEDDQRVQRVRLVIGGQNIDILEYYNNRAENTGTAYGAGTAGNSATYTSPKTGLLQVGANSTTNPTTGRVFFTDSIDLYRHRVEWAYIWDTEAIPSSTNVAANDIKVSVIAYPRDGAAGTAPKTTGSAEIPAPGAAHVATPDPSKPFEATRPNTSPYNREFPVGMNKYNSINVHLRPYITGFLRNKTLFSHDTRSRQGRYMFYRGETAVVKGFNLSSGGNNGSIIINGTSITTANVGTIGDFGIPATNNTRYRQFQVGTGVTTGNGLVTYTFSSRDAVNTSTERGRTSTAPIRPNYIQPWNIEYSPGIDGSTLWEDFTQAHIWQSNDTTSGSDNGRFPKGSTNNNMEVFDPSMSIDPATGTLWSSHNEGGGNGSNTGSTKIGNNSSNTSLVIAAFVDPIINSDIFISTRQSGYNTNNYNYTVWAAYSIIGKTGGGTAWASYGGIYVNGPNGGNAGLTSGIGVTANNGFASGNDFASRGQYLAESTYYNSQQNIPASGPALNQFASPHVITYQDGNNERIHVSYYDTKDGSVKYRHNLRGSPGNVSSTSAPMEWINLDGGSDAEDEGRIVSTPSRGLIDAGEYNSIALTSSGYPVVAYFDKTNQKIKLAISNNTNPSSASNWTIINNVISDVPAGRQNTFFGTGEYVSMKIDTRVTPNVVHIAAMNSMNKSLVYIKGTISGTTYTCVDVQVVDSVGSVGRWCALSLDSSGNPWISYQDEGYQGARDGAKLAYYNSSTYYKGGTSYFSGKDVDMYNVPITGWEAMHVPTQFRVENARQGMECYPTRNYTGSANKDWTGAVGYLGQDYFRIAYYIWK